MFSCKHNQLFRQHYYIVVDYTKLTVTVWGGGDLTFTRLIGYDHEVGLVEAGLLQQPALVLVGHAVAAANLPRPF